MKSGMSRSSRAWRMRPVRDSHTSTPNHPSNAHASATSHEPSARIRIANTNPSAIVAARSSA